jgi:hypothetical protein
MNNDVRQDAFIGHNSGLTPERGESDLSGALNSQQLKDQLAVDYDNRVSRTEALLEAAERLSQQTAHGFPTADLRVRANDFVGQLKTEAGLVKAAHKKVKAPVLEASRVIDGFFLAGLANRLTEAVRLLEDRMTAYDRAEEQRRRAEAEAAARAAEEAARQAEVKAKAGANAEAIEIAIAAARRAEEAARHAAAPAAEHSRLHGDLGTVSSLRRRFAYRVIDERAVPREFLMIDETAVMAAGKAGTDVPGIEFYYETRTTVRSV